MPPPGFAPDKEGAKHYRRLAAVESGIWWFGAADALAAVAAGLLL